MSLFQDQIPLLRPWLGEEEAQAAREVILSGWVSQGPVVGKFEKEVAAYVGSSHGVATNAATSALHLALVAIGARRGDEVICPATTCMATANAIEHAGATPVFCDIDAHTFNLTPAHVREALTDRTRGIMVVHQIGLPAPIEEIEAIAHERGLWICEDAATALGARYRGQYLGARGNPTCFSFHPRKMITTGEGGMLLTNHADHAERVRVLRAAGASISDLVRHQALGTMQQEYREVGFNYRMTDIQAAVGLVQMKKLPEMLRQRAEQARYYDQNLADIDEVAPPFVPDYAQHCYSSYCVTIRGANAARRDEILDSLARARISCRRGIPPLYREPHFRARWPHLVLPESERVAASTLFLPIFPGLSQSDQDRVIASLKNALR